MPAFQPRRWRVARVFVATAVAALMLLPASIAVAQVRDLFVVEGVRVDETADNAEAAREQAIVTGERRAFEVLLERITAPEDRARLGTPPLSAIEALIKDFWISDEKASRVRYIAVFNFNFRPGPVRDFLRNSGVAFSTQPAPPAVIIPVMQTESGPLLWEETNPWRAAWAGKSGTALRPLRMPPVTEALRLSADQAIAGDTAALAGDLNVDEVIVALADIPPPQPGQPLELRLTLNRVDRNGQMTSTPITLRGRPGEDAASLLKRGARETALVLDAAWKGQTRTTPRPTQITAVEIPVDSLTTWLTIERKLATIDAVEGVNIVLVARDYVRINLVYGSSPGDLTTVMRAAGLELTTESDPWTLRLGEATAPALVPSASAATPPSAPPVATPAAATPASPSEM